MSGNMTLALLTAQTGLAANQAALDTVTNNITNANSPTYSRKIAVFEQRTVNGVGAGVQISKVIRNVDEGLLRSLRNLYSGLNETTIQDTYFKRMQDLFGTPADNSSISHILTKFTSAIESLAVSPEKPLEQTEVIRWAQETTLKIKQIDETIQDLRLEADIAIANEVAKLNSITERIKSLNEQITRNKVSETDITGLEDQRDADINSLSEIISIKYFTRANGEVVVYSSAGKVLVDSVPVDISHAPVSKVNSLFLYDSGDFDGIWVGSRTNSANDITDNLGSGTLKGLVDIRDNVLGGLQFQINELSSQMRDIVNQEHNRGIPFPGMQEMAGTRIFADPALQTITLDDAAGVDDVAIVMTDADGNQTALTTLETIMTSATYGSAAQAADGPWTINEVATTIQDWLRANGAVNAVAAVDASGKFNIQLNESSAYLGFRDQVATANGSAHEDASIGFDADGANGIDETVGGFSNFFGLNDFFVDHQNSNIFDSDALPSTYISTAATLDFRNTTGSIVTPGPTLSIPAGSSLGDIASIINNGVTGVSASVIADGSHQRLRIIQSSQDVLVITQDVTGGDTLLDDIGLKKSNAQTAGMLEIRSDIASLPANMSRGAVQWDAGIGVAGEYYTSSGDASSILSLAQRFASTVSFNTTGGIASSTVTFSDYSVAILSNNASLASTNELQIEYKSNLTASLQNKSDSIRGVNLDEEMSQLMLFEQAYVAATRVMSSIQKMLEALEAIV